MLPDGLYRRSMSTSGDLTRLDGAQWGMKNGMTPIHHPTGGFLYSGTPKRFIPFLIPFPCRTDRTIRMSSRVASFKAAWTLPIFSSISLGFSPASFAPCTYSVAPDVWNWKQEGHPTSGENVPQRFGLFSGWKTSHDDTVAIWEGAELILDLSPYPPFQLVVFKREVPNLRNFHI